MVVKELVGRQMRSITADEFGNGAAPAATLYISTCVHPDPDGRVFWRRLRRIDELLETMEPHD